MVSRIYVEKRPGYQEKAAQLLHTLRHFLGISRLAGVRILMRYDVEGADKELLERAKDVVFGEPAVDIVSFDTYTHEKDESFELIVQALPGQFDQTADSCAQCIQMLSQDVRPRVQVARVYLFSGDLSADDREKIEHYLVNPVENQVVSDELPKTLAHTSTTPSAVRVLDGFCEADQATLQQLLKDLGLAMDLADLTFLQRYFAETEKRDPTITEIRVVDTYWSDHCRHTTYATHLDEIEIENPRVQAAYERYLDARREVYGEAQDKRPVTLMDIATIGTKVLKKRGLLPELDESEEINACSIHMDANVDGEVQDWLLMFKNETHNHPTEIEPFGGSATCIGGCIRDPLSGRAYVHQAMRVSGAADPRTPFDQTLEGKLPQRQIVTTAAEGYSSYGNQIGLATGQVSELYHPGYVAKRLECGAVVAAAPARNVRREKPQPGDVVLLLGGRTGRDGIGGATGSSKSHSKDSLATMVSEVQKGNAPEERKIQRLFRNAEATRLIKRCNDFGAGGVSVAVGELADGLEINLDSVRKKYEGMEGTELAISESQERMAVVLAPQDVKRFCELAEAENLEAYPVAVVTEEPYMKMLWNGEVIAHLSREFLNTNGTSKVASVKVEKPRASVRTHGNTLREIAASLRHASQRGLVERFDSTIGAGSLLMPYGGATQRTPSSVMAALLPVLPGHTTTSGSVMSYGCELDFLTSDPYLGAYMSVKTALSKLVAAGADYKRAYLSLQEYFCRLGTDPERWALPFEAMLGALAAQLDFGAAAIGGKDSMSGTFLHYDVPPTLIAFAVAPCEENDVLSNEFKRTNSNVYLFFAPTPEEQKTCWEAFFELAQAKQVLSAHAVDDTLAATIFKASLGNNIGFVGVEDVAWYTPCPGAIIVETTKELDAPFATLLGHTQENPIITLGDDSEEIATLSQVNEAVLQDVYPFDAPASFEAPLISYEHKTSLHANISLSKPRVLIPVFPGTNCEYDSERVCQAAGLETETVVINNLSQEHLKASAEKIEQALRASHILFIPGGFSGGDEPDGSAKFIVSFFRNPRIKEAVEDLLNARSGLTLGICNGFQALIKLGLVPFGHIIDPTDAAPTLTYNTIGRHQSKIVRTRVASTLSPWLSECELGEVFLQPISHGEGRFVASEETLRTLAEHGQIATQYVDAEGMPSHKTADNPNGSLWSVEGITSPDGRVFGKMGHAERLAPALYKNVSGNYDMGLFRAAKVYFK